MKFSTLAMLALLACLLGGKSAAAGDSRELGWDDLIPGGAGFEDPLDSLDDIEMIIFTEVLFVRDQLETNREVDAETLAMYRENVAFLEEQGVDVEGLVTAVDRVSEKRLDKTLETNPELEGRRVRIPGYMLPLEFDGRRVTEFLLVPYVGACIHTPPPPPTQIVHVKSKNGFESSGRLFQPVWVDGPIRIEGGATVTRLMDGSDLIYSAYSIDAEAVENY